MSVELVPDQRISHDVVEALETLLAAARTGQVTGLAFAAVLRQQRFIADVSGTCVRNLTHARGMLIALDDELGNIVRQRDPGETR